MGVGMIVNRFTLVLLAEGLITEQPGAPHLDWLHSLDTGPQDRAGLR